MSTGLENLEIYKLAERLEVYIYKITKKFPLDERYRSVNQLRKSSSSVADQIAESCGRYTFADRIHKLYIARGEAEETKRGIERCYKKGFISAKIADFICDKYTILIKQINAYIKFLKQQEQKYKSKPVNRSTDQPVNHPGVSLLMVTLITGVIIVATLAVSQVVLRQGQVTKGAEISEKAYFAAETGIEKAAYQIFKEGADITGYSLSGTLTNNATYQITSSDLTVDYKNPDTGVEINQNNPWQINLAAGQSFSLGLDIDGPSYPNTLRIERSGNQPSGLIIRSWLKSGGGDEQTFIVSFPYNFNIDSSNRFYQIRINNRSTSSESYTLRPTSPAGAKLPIGLLIKAKGSFSSYQRTIQSNFPRWQKFGI